MKKKNGTKKKKYLKPQLRELGDMIKVTLPGGSKSTEGNSGKGRP